MRDEIENLQQEKKLLSDQVVEQAAKDAAQKVKDDVAKQYADAEKLREETAAKRKKLAEIRKQKMERMGCRKISLCAFDDVCEECFVKTFCVNQKCFKEVNGGS